MPEVSVVVPTRNRAGFLGACLVSLCEQTIAPTRYDICVVNNDSADNTPEIVVQTAAKYPQHKIFMVHEPVIGLSVARNTGIRETNSPLVAMSDDDATMPPDWLERFLARFAELDVKVAKVGGEIVPVWAAPRPAWITDAMLPMLSASTGFKQEPHFSDMPLMEGNSCFRREAILQAGGFPPQLGRSGNMLLSADQIVDMIMFLRGWKLFFDPAIVIHHTIHADRLTPEWMRKRYFWQGVSDYVARIYLKEKGVTVNQAVSLELPLDTADWEFINNVVALPNEAHLLKFHSLGLVLAMGGMIPVEACKGR